jgi:transcriptional regulator GlxA family with amidase domain
VPHTHTYLQANSLAKKRCFLVSPDSPVADRLGHSRESGREIKNSFANAPQFDVLIIPGSFSTRELSTAAQSFLCTQCSSPELLAVLSIASGVLHLVQSGLLYRRRASAPRCLVSALQQRYPETQWQTKPWDRHEKMWTSAAAVSALDMTASWMREYFWDRHEAVECALAAAGLGLIDDFEY